MSDLRDRIEQLIADMSAASGGEINIDDLISQARQAGIDASDDEIKKFAFEAVGENPDIDEAAEKTLTVPPSYSDFRQESERSHQIARAAYKAIRNQTAMTKKQARALTRAIQSAILSNGIRLTMYKDRDDQETRKQLYEIKEYLVTKILPNLDFPIEDEEKDPKFKLNKERGEQWNAILKDLFTRKKDMAKSIKLAEIDKISANIPYFVALVSYVMNQRTPIEDPALSTLFLSNKSFEKNLQFLSPLERIQFINQLNERFDLATFSRGEGKAPNFYVDSLLSNFVRQIKEKKGGCDALNRTLDQALLDVRLNFAFFFDEDKEQSVNKIVRHLKRLYSCQSADVETQVRLLVNEMYGPEDDEDSQRANSEEIQNHLLEEYVFNLPEYELLRMKLTDEVFDELVRMRFKGANELQSAFSFGQTEDEIAKKYELDPLMFLGEDIKPSALEELRNTFTKIPTRKEILTLRKMFLTKYGDLKDKSNYDEIKQTIQEQFDNRLITEQTYNFFNFFTDVYEDLSRIPASGRNYGVLRLNKVSDLPARVQENVAEKIRAYASYLQAEKDESKLLEKRRMDVMTKIQILLNQRVPNVSKILVLLADLELDPTVRAQIEKDLKGSTPIFNNIYRLIVSGLHRNRQVRDPLSYTGVKRSARVRMHAGKNIVQKTLESIPPVSPYLKLCMTWHTLKPWLKLPASFRYYIAHPTFTNKKNLSPAEQAYFGKRIVISNLNTNISFGNQLSVKPDYNVYAPSNSFWKNYCQKFFTEQNGKSMLGSSPRMCNVKGLVTSFVDEKKRDFILGVYDSKNPDNNRFLNEQDFVEECKWFESENVKPIVESAKWFNTPLVGDQKTAAFKIAIDLFINVLIKIPAFQSRAQADSKSIVLAIYNSIPENQRTVYAFFKEVERILYVINPESPVSKFANYAKTLLLETSHNALQTIVTKSNLQLFPEQLLLDAKSRAEFLRLSDIHIDEQAQRDAISLKKTLNPYDKNLKVIPTDTWTYDSTIKILTPLLGQSLHNACSNKSEINGEIELVYVEDNVLKCLSHIDINEILEDKSNKVIPQDVIEEIRLMYTYDQDDVDIIHTKIQRFTEDFVGKNFLAVLEEINEHDKLTNDEIIVSGDVIESQADYPVLFELINGITSLVQDIKDADLDLALGHASTFVKKLYKGRLAATIDDFIYSSVGASAKIQFIKDAKKRAQIYNNDVLQMRQDKNRRLEIISPLFAKIESLYNIPLTEQDKHNIVDSISVMFKLPESIITAGDMNRTRADDLCNVCTSNKYDVLTYACMKPDDSKYVNGCMKLCNSCFTSTVDRKFDMPSKKALQEVEVRELIYDFLKDYTLYDDLADALRSKGIEFDPTVNSKADLWSEWLKRKWYMDEESITHGKRKHILERLLEYFQIPQQDNLYKSYEAMMKDDKFLKIYDEVVDRYYGTGIRERPADFITMEMKQPFVDGCPVSKYSALEFVNTVARTFVDRTQFFDLTRNLIVPYFSKFKDCPAPDAEQFKEVRNIDNLLRFLQQVNDLIVRYNVRNVNELLDKTVELQVQTMKPEALEKLRKTSEMLNAKSKQFKPYTEILKSRVIAQSITPVINTLDKYTDINVEGDSVMTKLNAIFTSIYKLGYVGFVEYLGLKSEWANIVDSVNRSKLIIYRLAYAFLERMKYLAEVSDRVKMEEAEVTVGGVKMTRQQALEREITMEERKKKKQAIKARVKQNKPQSWAEFSAEFERLEDSDDEAEFFEEERKKEMMEEVSKEAKEQVDFELLEGRVAKSLTRADLIVLQNNINIKLALYDIPDISIFYYPDYEALDKSMVGGVAFPVSVKEIIKEREAYVREKAAKVHEEKEKEFEELLPSNTFVQDEIDNIEKDRSEDIEEEYKEINLEDLLGQDDEMDVNKMQDMGDIIDNLQLESYDLKEDEGDEAEGEDYGEEADDDVL